MKYRTKGSPANKHLYPRCIFCIEVMGPWYDYEIHKKWHRRHGDKPLPRMGEPKAERKS